MKGLASYVMRGLSQAVMVTSVLALLSLFLPLLGIISAAVVGLVTLRQGARNGLRVALLSTLAAGIILALSIANPLPVLGFLVLQWFPLWLLGGLLRSTRSLNLSLQAALGFGVLAILVQYLLLGDPAQAWLTQLQPLMEQLSKSGVVDASQGTEFTRELAGWMAGVLAAGIFLQLILSLLLARWWQAQLYNPGGFRSEFRQLRVSKWLGVVGLPALAVLLLSSLEAPELLRHFGTLLLAPFFLLGLAVVHATLGSTGAGTAWLIAVYLLLFVVMPQAVLMLALIGLLDVWIDFRRRFERYRSAG